MRDSMITTINIGRLRGDLGDWYQLPPEHRYAHEIEPIAILCYHVAWPGRSVLVDAAAYDFALGGASLAQPGPHPPPLDEQLSAAGADPSTVTDVVITHAHFDHINGLTKRVDGHYVPAFPNARHYLARVIGTRLPLKTCTTLPWASWSSTACCNWCTGRWNWRPAWTLCRRRARPPDTNCCT